MHMKLFLSFIFAALLTGCWQTEEGTKTGTLVKVTNAGLFFKTWQGELIRGGFSDGSGANGKSFNFNLGTVLSENVKKSIYLMGIHKPVEVKYHCELFVAPWRGENNCFVDALY